MKVSYLVTCHNEAVQLRGLLYLVNIYRTVHDEVVVLDDFSDDEYTIGVLKEYEKNGMTILRHSLNNNYGAHKNFGIEKCIGNFIFQLDADERPPESLLGENLHALLESNPTIEAYAVPRINDFRGVTPEHAKRWGWRLTPSSMCDNRLVVNFPDYQFRIFRRDYPRISFIRRLHEKIEGYASYVALPPKEEYALYHNKTIETQIATNLRYNQAFTQEENKGHGVFTK